MPLGLKYYRTIQKIDQIQEIYIYLELTFTLGATVESAEMLRPAFRDPMRCFQKDQQEVYQKSFWLKK